MGRLEKSLLTLSCLVVGVYVLNFFNIVGFFYLRAVDNDPFPAMVEVTKVAGDRIQLKDGRDVRISGGIDAEFATEVRDCNDRIGFEADGGTVNLYSRRPRTICGLGMPMIVVPLIPIDVPRYRSHHFAIGKIVIDSTQSR